MHTSNKTLPSLNEFKSEAKRLNKGESFKKLGHAQNALAKKHGYKDFNAIRPVLIALENANNTDTNLDSDKHFDESNEEIITMKMLKNIIKDSLEYSDPNDMLMIFSSHPLDINMKPIVGDKFFDTEDEAVAYELSTSEYYKNVKNCSDGTKIVEKFDKDGNLLPYIIY